MIMRYLELTLVLIRKWKVDRDNIFLQLWWNHQGRRDEQHRLASATQSTHQIFDPAADSMLVDVVVHIEHNVQGRLDLAALSSNSIQRLGDVC